jgi:hypothetical protein
MHTYAHAHPRTQSLPHFVTYIWATISTILITITCCASPLGLDNRHSHHSMVTVTLLRTQRTPTTSLIKPDNGFYKFAKAFTRHDVQQQVSGHVDDLPVPQPPSFETIQHALLIQLLRNRVVMPNSHHNTPATTRSCTKSVGFYSCWQIDGDKRVRTGIGRGRAWIRIALNEGASSLEACVDLLLPPRRLFVTPLHSVCVCVCVCVCVVLLCTHAHAHALSRLLPALIPRCISLPVSVSPGTSACSPMTRCGGPSSTAPTRFSTTLNSYRWP